MRLKTFWENFKTGKCFEFVIDKDVIKAVDKAMPQGKPPSYVRGSWREYLKHSKHSDLYLVSNTDGYLFLDVICSENSGNR